MADHWNYFGGELVDCPVTFAGSSRLGRAAGDYLYARKLLHRIATDIHDGPLQEFKIVMDRIELLQLDHPDLEDPIYCGPVRADWV